MLMPAYQTGKPIGVYADQTSPRYGYSLVYVLPGASQAPHTHTPAPRFSRGREAARAAYLQFLQLPHTQGNRHQQPHNVENNDQRPDPPPPIAAGARHGPGSERSGARRLPACTHPRPGRGGLRCWEPAWSA